MFILFSNPSLAKEGNYGLTKTIAKGNLYLVFNESNSDLVDRVGGVVGVILSFVGLFFLILMIYSGVMWMTASGNEQQIDKSKKTMIWAVIGIICIFASFAVVQFIGEQSTKSVYTEEATVGGTSGTINVNNDSEQPILLDAQQKYIKECMKDGEYVTVSDFNPSFSEESSWDDWSSFSDDGNTDRMMSNSGEVFLPYSQELCTCFSIGGSNCGVVLCEYEVQKDILMGIKDITKDDCKRLYGSEP